MSDGHKALEIFRDDGFLTPVTEFAQALARADLLPLGEGDGRAVFRVELRDGTGFNLAIVVDMAKVSN